MNNSENSRVEWWNKRPSFTDPECKSFNTKVSEALYEVSTFWVFSMWLRQNPTQTLAGSPVTWWMLKCWSLIRRSVQQHSVEHTKHHQPRVNGNIHMFSSLKQAGEVHTWTSRSEYIATNVTKDFWKMHDKWTGIRNPSGLLKVCNKPQLSWESAAGRALINDGKTGLTSDKQ